MRIDYRFPNLKYGGFGNLGNGVLKYLQKRGHIITRDNPDAILCYGPDDVMNGLDGHSVPLVYYTVWESSKYPSNWTSSIRRYRPDLVLTATEFTKESLKEQGIESKVWHHAVNDHFESRERTHDGFRFIHWNAYEWRKGWELVVMAFVEEFKEDEDVQLVLLARDRGHANFLVDHNNNIDFGHKNIKEVIGALNNDGLMDLICSADVGVFPVKGEGWFMPSQEFAATGGVPMLPNRMGLSEQWIDGYIDIELDGYINAEPRYPGYMMMCSIKDIRKKMRWAFENKELIRKTGKELSKKVKKKFNWSKIIVELENHLNSVL